MQGIQDLLDKKQNEYLSYYMRYRIYTYEPEKNKMQDICGKIQKTIEEISFRSRSPSIFTSESLKEKKIKRFLNEKGLPNLSYRNEFQQKMKGFWDRFYLFKEDSEVVYSGEIHKIVEVKTMFPPTCDFGKQIKISNGSRTFWVDYSDVVILKLEEIFKKIQI